MYDDSAPGAFRDLALAALIEGDDGSETGDALDDREERLLVRKVLQGRPWESVADELGTSRRPPACGRSATPTSRSSSDTGPSSRSKSGSDL